MATSVVIIQSEVFKQWLISSWTSETEVLASKSWINKDVKHPGFSCSTFGLFSHILVISQAVYK